MPNLYPRLFARHFRLPAAGDPWNPKTLPSGGAVVAFVAHGGALVQLLSTQSLRRAAIARLASTSVDSPKRRANLREVTDTLWWQPTYSVFETTWVYLNISRQLLGDDYRAQLGFGPVWCACLDTNAAYPHWIPKREPFAKGVVAAGPFRTRKSCASFIENLVDLFDLCRDHDILEQTPHGTRCVYYDMGKCPAPCDGTVGLGVFRNSLSASIHFATGGVSDYLEEIGAAMQRASEQLDFEVAQRLKEKIDRVREAARNTHRLSIAPETCRHLIVQAGSHRGWLRPFFADAGRIEPGAEVHRDELGNAVPQWRAWFTRSDNARPIAARYRTEGLWLVSHFLSKGKKASGIYLNMHQPPDAPAILERIREVFFGRSTE